MLRLWIDDIRTPPDDSWLWAKDSRGAIIALETALGMELTDRIEIISYDHDLGGDDTSRKVIMWQCENDVWPQVAQIHSGNPIGRDWLYGMIQRYGEVPIRVVHYAG